MVARYGIQYAVNECVKKQQGFRLVREFDPDRLLAFIQDIDMFLSKDIKIRTEGSIFSIYCNDETLFNSMLKKLDHWITEIHVPANDAEQAFIEANGQKKVLCNHLPFQRYQYRVYIKEKINADTRDKVWNWMSKYDGKFRVPHRVAMWMTGRKQWVTSPSLYVQDGPTLSMLLLFLGDRVSKVEEFVPRSVINTLSEEQPCLV